jgi:hypothetical protein
MLKSIISLVCVLICSTVVAQYAHFNNIYRLDETGINFLSFNSMVIHGKYFCYQTALDQFYNDYFCIDQVDMEGNLVATHDELITEPVTFNTYGLSEYITLLLKDSSVVLLNSRLSDCENSLQSIGLTRFMDTTRMWTTTYDELLGDCNDYHRYLPQGLINIDDSTFMMFSIARIGPSSNNPLESGFAFTYFDYDGNVLANYFNTNNSVSGDIPRHVFKYGDQLFIHGDTNGQGEQQMIAKFDFEGNMLDSILMSNINQPRNGAGAGEIMDNGKFLYVHASTTSFNPFTLGVTQDIYVATIEPATLGVDSDVIINSPTDGMNYRGLGLISSLKSSNNELVVLAGYYENDLVTSHQMLWKLDAEGNVLWQTEYWPLLPYGACFFNSFIETPDKGYLVTGTYESEDYSQQKNWLLKVDACGYEEPNGCPEFVSVWEENDVPDLIIWPNPFYHTLKAVLPENAESISITDIQGRLVLKENVYYSRQQWNLENLESGVYIFNIQLENGVVATRRVVKQ